MHPQANSHFLYSVIPRRFEDFEEVQKNFKNSMRYSSTALFCPPSVGCNQMTIEVRCSSICCPTCNALVCHELLPSWLAACGDRLDLKSRCSSSNYCSMQRKITSTQDLDLSAQFSAQCKKHRKQVIYTSIGKPREDDPMYQPYSKRPVPMSTVGTNQLMEAAGLRLRLLPHVDGKIAA